LAFVNSRRCAELLNLSFMRVVIFRMQLIRPGAACVRNQAIEMPKNRPLAISHQLSALSTKNTLVKRLISNGLKNFFAKYREVTDKDSIHSLKGAGVPSGISIIRIGAIGTLRNAIKQAGIAVESFSEAINDK
jgi:hypothetical protein